ncbi:MAG: hypothetical protein KatS3mg115_0120 [Candidatus Poribacteria bacterium]|nr:MAG: hypothetical protein KatS3mg115_0120 [Candidatus Poribacteria bacterium]
MQAKRTVYCGQLRKEHVGQEHCLMGWVQRHRDHGGLIFVDLRDRTGIVQVVMDPQISPQAHRVGERVRSEYVLAVAGKVRERMPGTVNPNLPTGEVELAAETVEILNPALTPPLPRRGRDHRRRGGAAQVPLR